MDSCCVPSSSWYPPYYEGRFLGFGSSEPFSWKFRYYERHKDPSHRKWFFLPMILCPCIFLESCNSKLLLQKCKGIRQHWEHHLFALSPWQQRLHSVHFLDSITFTPNNIIAPQWEHVTVLSPKLQRSEKNFLLESQGRCMKSFKLSNCHQYYCCFHCFVSDRWNQSQFKYEGLPPVCIFGCFTIRIWALKFLIFDFVQQEIIWNLLIHSKGISYSFSLLWRFIVTYVVQSTLVTLSF